MMVSKAMVSESNAMVGDAGSIKEFEFAIGAEVRVNLSGTVVARSEFRENDSYLIEYERRGKTQREWIVADKLELDGAIVERTGGAA